MPQHTWVLITHRCSTFQLITNSILLRSGRSVPLASHFTSLLCAIFPGFDTCYCSLFIASCPVYFAMFVNSSRISPWFDCWSNILQLRLKVCLFLHSSFFVFFYNIDNSKLYANFWAHICILFIFKVNSFKKHKKTPVLKHTYYLIN